MTATWYTSDHLLEVSGTQNDADEIVWTSTAVDEEDARYQLAREFGVFGQTMLLEVSTL